MEPTVEQTIQQVNQLFEKKEYQEIIALLSETLLTRYNNATLYKWISRVCRKLKMKDLAFAYAQKSIEIDPISSMAYLSRGDTWAQKKEYNKALADYDEAIRLDSNDTIAFNNRGNTWCDLKEYDKAIADYTEAIRLDPNDASAFYNRADTWVEKKEYDKAIDDYTDAIRLDPNDADAYINRGSAWAEKKEYNKAIDDYTDAIRLDPNDTDAFNNRGNAWCDLKEYDKGLADYNEAIQLDSNNASAFTNRGNVWVEKKEYDKSIADHNEAIRLDPNDGDVYRNRADTWAEKREYDKSIADYTEAIRLNPNDTIAFYNRGLVSYNRNEYDKAIDDYTNSIRLDPYYTDSYINRGISWYYRNEYDKAIDDYTNAIQLNPKDALAFNNRGSAWAEKKEYDKAIADYNEAIRLNPNNTDAFYNRGNAWAEKKEYNKAIADYERSVELTNDSNAYYRQVSLAKIEELKKKLENTWYNEIDNLVNEISELLLFNSACLTHYTSLSGARAMILENSPFRLSEGAFLNDTSEGRELFNYLSFEMTKPAVDETVAELFVERPFIGSFVSDTKHNDLTLWRMYGKEAQAEAKGCALTIYKTNFIDDLKKKIGPIDTKAGIPSQSEEQFTFYNVAYRLKNTFTIPGKTKASEKLLNMLMAELKDKVKELNINQKISITKRLNDIAYLFKSSEYQYENEVRLVVQGVGFTKKIENKDDQPKVYIELIDIVPTLNKITMGPKVERADEWAAAFNYHIKAQLIDRKKKVEIIISHLPFK